MNALTLDHVGYVGRDLAPLRAAMQRLGFAPTEPQPLLAVDPATGRDVPLDQHSCHVVLERGYLELSAVLTRDPAHHLAPWLARGTGLHILALGSDDPAALRDRCLRNGLPCSAVAAATRRIEYGQRQGIARFQWFMLQPSATPAGLICFVRNETPQLVYQPEVSRHPNGAVALEEIYLVSPDVQRFSAQHAVWLGRAPTRVDEWLRFELGAGSV
ncbi:MAG: VOC family protein, partial [Steroidobacteraceae bacterium]|nr:VOC family protein [Steroidobacteraceae bacterium]